MREVRALSTIDADIAAINAERARIEDVAQTLLRERAAAVVARDRAIVGAFGAGERVKDIAARLELTLNTVYGVLDRNDQKARKRQTPISHLPAEQQRAYHKARHFGAGPAAARQMATAVPL